MKNINKTLTEHAKLFVKEVCIDTWGLSEQEVKDYCLMIVKQNLLMSQIDKDYLATATAYAPLAGSIEKNKN